MKKRVLWFFATLPLRHKGNEGAYAGYYTVKNHSGPSLSTSLALLIVLPSGFRYVNLNSRARCCLPLFDCPGFVSQLFKI